MGLFDGILGYFSQQGQATIGQVTQMAPYTGGGPAPTGGSSPSYQSAPAPQPVQINPVGAITTWGANTYNYIGGGIQNVSSGIQSFISPIQSPSVTNPIQQVQMSVINPVQNFINPSYNPTQIATPTGISGGAAYLPISTVQSQQMPTGMSLYVPYGNQAQTQVNNLSAIVYDPVGGGFAGYVVPYGHSITNIVTSGSTGSLQSGMFSTKPLTPVVYTQESAGTVFAPTAVPAAAALVLASPQSYSRLGAEAYGGYVQPLDNRVLSPTTPVSVYSTGSGNLASLVNPMGVNYQKQTWAEVPWNVPVTQTGMYSITPTGTMTPLVQMSSVSKTEFMTTQIGGAPLPTAVRQERNWLDQMNYDIGGFLGIRASGLEQTGTQTAMLPAPFKSTPQSLYEYRNDPLAIALEGAAWAGDTLTFGVWKPGAAQIAKYGQTGKENQYEYGAFSEWRMNVSQSLRGGTTEAKIAEYEQSPQFKNAGAFTWFGEGSWKVLTDPVGMAGSALQGVEIYATMGLATAGFTALAPAAVPTATGIGSYSPLASTVSEQIGITGLRTMASPIFQYGTGALFLGAGVWSSTEGFTAPPERSTSNLGGMTIHLAAMTAGAMAPEGIARVGNYATPQFSEFTGSIGSKISEIRQYGIKETIAQKIPTYEQIKYSFFEWRSPTSAISKPAASERFIQPSREGGDFTGSAKAYFRAREYSASYGEPRRGGSVSGRPTPSQESLRENYNPTAPLKEIQTTPTLRTTVSTSGVFGAASSGMRGSQLGRWDTRQTGTEDALKNLPLKERWKAREGGYAQASGGGGGGYYGSGSPTGNLQSGVGVGGTTVRSGRQTLEFRSASSGMAGPQQDLAPQTVSEQMGMTPRSRYRQRAEELSYEYESRQVPPEMRRPAPTESVKTNEQFVEQARALDYTPALWISPSLSVATAATQKSAQVSSTFSIQKSDVATISQQAQEQRASQIQVPALASMTALASVPMSAQKFMQDQIQTPRQFQEQLPVQTPWQGSLPIQRQQPVQTPVQTPRTFIPTIPEPVMPVISRPPTPPVPPTRQQIDVPWKQQPPELSKPPALPFFGNVSPSGGGGGSRKRRGAFVEIFNMGLDYSLRQRSKRQGKSWTQPKKVREARAAAKKGGKKK